MGAMTASLKSIELLPLQSRKREKQRIVQAMSLTNDREYCVAQSTRNASTSVSCME
jgi:hypothetical protein